MTTANWITLIVTLVGLATTWGAVQARLKQVEKTTEKTADDFATSRGAQGARIGVVEERIAHLEGSLGVPEGRRRNITRQIPATGDND